MDNKIYSTSKSNFAAIADTLVLDVRELNTVLISITGTYTMTLVFEASDDDGITWFPIQVASVASSSIATSHSTTNATTSYEASCHAFTLFRVRCSAFTSVGTHTVRITGTSRAVEPAPVAQISGTVSVSATPANPTSSIFATAASTNAAVVKSSAGSLFNVTISNVTATAAYVKLYNKSTAPTVGTDVPAITIPAPANTTVNHDIGSVGARFSSGIGRAVTAAAVATDTGVAVAGIQVQITYI